MKTKKSGGPKLSRAIGYIRKRVPSFDLPPYEGRRYEAMVPDTLDIQERIALAVNGLRSIAIEKDDLAYFKHGGYGPSNGTINSAMLKCVVATGESIGCIRLNNT